MKTRSRSGSVGAYFALPVCLILFGHSVCNAQVYGVYDGVFVGGGRDDSWFNPANWWLNFQPPYDANVLIAGGAQASIGVPYNNVLNPAYGAFVESITFDQAGHYFPLQQPATRGPSVTIGYNSTLWMDGAVQSDGHTLTTLREGGEVDVLYGARLIATANEFDLGNPQYDTYYRAGTVSMQGGSLQAGTLVVDSGFTVGGVGSVNAVSITNHGHFVAQGGTLSLDFGGPSTNDGSMIADGSDATLILNATNLTDHGTVTAINGGALVLAGGVFPNDGTYSVAPGNLLVIAGTLDNSGRTLNADASFALSDLQFPSSQGTIRGGTVTGALRTLNLDTRQVGWSGNLDGVTLSNVTLNGNFFLINTVVNNGLLAPPPGGAMSLSGNLQNNGVISDASGAGTVSLTGTVTGGQLSGNLQAGNYLTLTNVQLDGSLTINGRFDLSGTISGNNSFSPPPGPSEYQPPSIYLDGPTTITGTTDFGTNVQSSPQSSETQTLTVTGTLHDDYYLFLSGIDVVNEGTISTGPGGKTYIGGTLIGGTGGKVVGDLEDDGTIQASAGQPIKIAGSLTITAGAVYTADPSGGCPLSVDGNLTITPTGTSFNGTTVASELQLVNVAVGNSYIIAKYGGAFSGSFGSVAPGWRVVDDAAAQELLAMHAIAGDVNADGTVDFTDLLTLAQNYGQSGVTWAEGDLNGDGTVNFADLLALAQNYGSQQDLSPAISAVPEPSFLVPLICAAGILPRIRRIVMRVRTQREG